MFIIRIRINANYTDKKKGGMVQSPYLLLLVNTTLYVYGLPYQQASITFCVAPVCSSTTRPATVPSSFTSSGLAMNLSI